MDNDVEEKEEQAQKEHEIPQKENKLGIYIYFDISLD